MAPQGITKHSDVILQASLNLSERGGYVSSYYFLSHHRLCLSSSEIKILFGILLIDAFIAFQHAFLCNNWLCQSTTFITMKKNGLMHLIKKRTKAKVCIIHNKFCWAFVQVHSTKNPPLCLIVLLKCLLYSHGSVCLITQMRIIKTFFFFLNFILLSAFSHEVMMLRMKSHGMLMGQSKR